MIVQVMIQQLWAVGDKNWRMEQQADAIQGMRLTCALAARKFWPRPEERRIEALGEAA
jgi:hypothetical protein